MGLRLDIQIAGDVQVSRELLRVSDRAGDMRPALRAVIGVMVEETQEQFATSGGHASKGWQPLAESTARAKARRGLDPRVLRATGALERSLTERGDKLMQERVTKAGLVWGSKVKYGGFHQRGTRHMPRRRPVEFTELARRRMVKVLQRYALTGELLA